MPRWPLLLALLPVIARAQQTSAPTSGYGAARGFVVESWSVANGLPVNAINQVMQSESGYIWLATFDGLVRFDGIRFSTFNTGNSEGLPSNRIVHIEEASDSALVVTTELNQRARFYKGVFSPIPPVSRPLPVRPTPLLAPNGQRWEAVRNEIMLDGRVVYRAPPGLGNSMSITSIALDREGSLWFGTTAAGLFQLKRALFDVYTLREGRGDNNLYSVAPASGGGVWAGAWSGSISRIENGRMTHYDKSHGVPDGVISIAEDSHHRLWLGDTPCALPTVTCGRPGLSPGTIVHAIHEADDGTLWFGTTSGVYLFRDGVWSQPPENEHPPRNTVRGFLRTSDGALWMATNGGGVVRYQNGTFRSITTREGLPSDLVRALYQDSDGWLWVGTEGMGIARLDPRDPIMPNVHARIATIRASDGLFDDGVHAILEDSSRRLWMSTNRGIFHVARSELNAFADGKIPRIRSTGYTERHGLLNREANGGSQPAATRSSDGRLWFATQEGVAVVDPARIGGNAVAPRVVIERVLAGGKPAGTVGDQIDIQPNRRDLEIEYTALSYLAPENIHFRYRLIPYDRDWVDADTRRGAVYTRVPPGAYRFEVVASDGEGARSRVAAATALTVVARFYETRVFKLLVLLCFALLVWAGVRWRLARLRRLAVDLQTRVDERTRELRQRESLLAEQNTQLGMQAEQLHELDRAKSRFFANVSHELRTPLTLTIGPIEDLRAELANTGSRHAVSRLDMALSNSKRLLTLVNQILDVAKLEAGSTKLRVTQDDLAEFVKGVTAAFSGAAESKAIMLRIESPIGGIEASFDHDAVEKIVSNLLSNALKFTPNGGRIAIAVDRTDSGRMARVSISDSGPGIPQEHIPHIFDRFYQVDETNTRAQPGTGIGLSLARELAELHGGTLGVESGPKGGATFTLSIPTGLGAEPDANAASEPAPSNADGDGMADTTEDVVTLLVVDDNADLRSYVRSRFDARYRVVEAADGADAIRRARALTPDLVISDVMMPGTDGHALCAALRASADTDFIPIILLTAVADQAERIAALGRGADDYIVKPFDMRELEARVENLLASRRLLRERFSGRQVQLVPSVESVSPADDDFIKRVKTAVEANIADPDFGVGELASAVFQERSYLFRRIREVFAQTPSDLLRRARLERAKAMLEDGDGSVSEVAYAAGFNSVSHFCRIFRAAYSATPSSWREAARKAAP